MRALWPVLCQILALLEIGFAVAADEGPRTRAVKASSHWAFEARRPGPLPSVRRAAWPQSPIDHYILASLESHELAPARPADRRTLIRRATYDLTGLPPTPEAVDRFESDPSPEAFARVIDRLLASPAYGERWARHWLDVVRYADARDLIQLPAESDFREAWRYRDWVVRAMNTDLPFGDFIRYQIAGDLLQPDRADAINEDAWVATGLLAIADFVPGDVDKERMIADYVNDQVDVVGRAFLGLTLACARCHDHKSDPITMEDYYSLAGIFFSTRLIPSPVKGNTPLVRVPLLCRAELDRIAQDRQRVGELELELQQIGCERDLEYFESVERLAAEQSANYLLALAEFRGVASGSTYTNLEAFARARGLSPPFLERWASRATTRSQHTDDDVAFAAVPGWQALLKSAAEGNGDPPTLRLAAQELQSALSKCQQQRQTHDGTDAAGKEAFASEIDRLWSEDPQLVTNSEGRVTHWPSRVRSLRRLAIPASASSGPVRTNVLIGGQARPVLRFAGKELLELGVTVPPAGSLFAVFRRADGNAEGQRLVGWEDSDAGRHGLGLMLKSGGGVHVIARADGVNGDVVGGAKPHATFEIVGVTWGRGETTLWRQGQREGSSKGVEYVSADPGIRRLRIGGPGSGGSARFAGDLAELRVFSEPLDEAACRSVEAELMRMWCSTNAAPIIPTDTVGQLLDSLSSQRGPFWLPEDQREAWVTRSVRARLRNAQEELASVRARLPAEIPQAVVVQDGGPAETKHAGFKDASIYLRGDPKRPGKSVPRGFPAVLAGGHQPSAASLTQASGRRQLADWLASPDNPLTARVAVNRIWQHHFGEGLVRTATNFGQGGERPSHPELLDYLAEYFVESGGSTKAMHRLLMLSATYQQESAGSLEAAAKDPENRLLSHMHRRRLEAEAIRDSLLAVAGQLAGTSGGKAVADLSAPRRSLYLMAVRTGTKSGFASLFDAPDCGAIVDRRSVSTVAPQALFLLNDAFTADRARRVAARVREAGGGAAHMDAVHLTYRQVLGRSPTPEELRIGIELLRNTSEGDPLERYCLVLLCTNEFIYLD